MLSAVQAIFDRFRGAEAQLFRGLDLNRFASRRVAALARGRCLHLELAEAADRDFVTLGRGVGDNGKDGVDGLAGVGLAEIQRCGDAVRQFGMVPLGTLLYLAGRWPGGKSL